MLCSFLFVLFFSLLQLSQGLKCSQHDLLSKMDFSNLFLQYTKLTDTPPSKTNETWWVRLCDENDSPLPSVCKQDDILCGITEVTVPGKEPLITQIIDYSEQPIKRTETVGDVLDITLHSIRWGSHDVTASLVLTCDTHSNKDTLTLESWEGMYFDFQIKGPSVCIRDDGQKPHFSGDSGRSWTKWLLMYGALFVGIYFVVTSYFNSRHSSIHEFREELMDRSSALASSLPTFAKEVAGKIIHGNGASRGGYSAV